MQKIFKLKMFYVGLVFSVAIIFLAAVNFNRAYVSTTHILIIPKSDAAAINSEQIIENLNNFPLTFSFYDKIKKEEGEDEINIKILDLPDYKKKAFWNSKLKVERVEKSGILKITTLDTVRYRAEKLNNLTVKNFINSVGSYYDIKNDIDIRIIDGPITNESNSKSNTFLFLISLFSGFVLTTVSFVLSFYLFEKKKAIENIRPDIFNFRKSFSKKEKGMEDLNKIILEEEEKKPLDFFEKDQIFPIKKAAAPDNLPIAPEEIEKTEKIAIAPQSIIREATAEEVKERLNKLLSGIGM